MYLSKESRKINMKYSSMSSDEFKQEKKIRSDKRKVVKRTSMINRRSKNNMNNYMMEGNRRSCFHQPRKTGLEASLIPPANTGLV